MQSKIPHGLTGNPRIKCGLSLTQKQGVGLNCICGVELPGERYPAAPLDKTIPSKAWLFTVKLQTRYAGPGVKEFQSARKNPCHAVLLLGFCWSCTCYRTVFLFLFALLLHHLQGLFSQFFVTIRDHICHNTHFPSVMPRICTRVRRLDVARRYPGMWKFPGFTPSGTAGCRINE